MSSKIINTSITVQRTRSVFEGDGPAVLGVQQDHRHHLLCLDALPLHQRHQQNLQHLHKNTNLNP